MSELPANDDPPPVAPLRPSQDDCCKGSCDPCVFDLYEQALERYRAELQAWQKRAPDREKDRSADRGLTDEQREV
jgi:hypothetical protein